MHPSNYAPTTTLLPGSRATIYIQTKGGGAADFYRQRSDLVRYCEDQACEVTTERSDVGFGNSIGPGLRDLIALASSKERPLDFVLVESLPRLCPSVSTFPMIIAKLDETGITLVSGSEQSLTIGMLKLEFTASLSQRQRQRQSQAMRRVWVRRKAEAAALGIPVTGKKHQCPTCRGRGWMEVAS